MKEQVFKNFYKWLEEELTVENSKEFISFEDRLGIYEKKLRDEGNNKKQTLEKIQIIKDYLFKIDIARWNKFYSVEPGDIHRSPNKFLFKTTKQMPPGTALDIGMGNGRNAIFLSEKGWKTTGLEASETALQFALKQAELRNLHLNAVLTNYEKFDFGQQQWDLIIMMYVSVREISDRVVESLTSRGSLIIESYLADAANRTIGNKVIYERQELPKIFKSLNTYFYEETEDFSDFESGKTPIVRFHAGKPKTQT